MVFNWSPITALNLALCIIVMILGFLTYTRNRNQVSLCLSIAFGLFGISHLLEFFRGRGSLEVVLIVVRLAAYILVIIALYKAAFETSA